MHIDGYVSERVEVARTCRKRTKLSNMVPLLVDDMGDAFVEAYSAWPLRFYGLVPGPASPSDATNTKHATAATAAAPHSYSWQVGFKAQPQENAVGCYDWTQLEMWVNNILCMRKQE